MSKDETLLENIRSLQKHYAEARQTAIEDEEEEAAAYYAGQVSGLIHAEEAIKEHQE